jgi:hypothetical protein
MKSAIIWEAIPYSPVKFTDNSEERAVSSFLFDTEGGGNKFLRIIGFTSQMIVGLNETIYLFSY